MNRVQRLSNLEHKAGTMAAPSPDPIPYSEWITRHLQIRTKDGRLLPLQFNPMQERLNDIFDVLKAQHGQAHIIVLKARQHGISTWFQSRIFERCARTENQQALVLAHDREGSDWLFGMSRLFKDTMPGCPPTDYSSKKEIVFSAPLRSSISVQVAHEFAGSARTVQVVHISELAKWENAPVTMLSLMQAAAYADVVIESTANGQQGRGSYFHKMWQDAKEGQSDYTPIFFAWFDNPGYIISTQDMRFGSLMAEPLGNEELALQESHKLSAEQMAWRRWAKRNLCANDEDAFKQEYPANDYEAFMRVEGRRVFDLGRCSAALARAQKFNAECPPIVGRLEWAVPPVLDQTGRCVNRDALRVRFSEDEHGPLRIWIPPQTDGPVIPHRYKGAGDVAKGVVGGDCNSGVILDRIERVICCAWHELCDSTLFGEYMALLAIFYGAEVAIEVNGVGHSALVKLLEIAGPRYTWATHKFQPGNPVSEFDRGRWGWTTPDRHYMAEGLRDVIREGRWTDPDIEAWGEIMNIVREASGRPAFTGKDRTMCRAILAHIDNLAPQVALPLDEPPKKKGDYSDWRAKKAEEERRYSNQPRRESYASREDWLNNLGLRRRV